MGHHQGLVGAGIDPAPLQRKALELIAEGHTWSELAIWAGYARKVGKGTQGDTSAIMRALGLRPERTGGKPRKMIGYRVACRLAKALDLDPVDAGV